MSRGHNFHSENTKEKIGRKNSIARKGKTWEEIYGPEQSEILKKKARERARELFESGFNPMQSEKARAKASEKQRLRFKNPSELRKVLVFNGQNKQEGFIEQLLHSMGYLYRFVGDGKVNINGKCPDFILGKKIIEFFGRHWHEAEEENERINFFKRFGYETLIIWSAELKDIPALKKKIEVFSYA